MKYNFRLAMLVVCAAAVTTTQVKAGTDLAQTTNSPQTVKHQTQVVVAQQPSWMAAHPKLLGRVNKAFDKAIILKPMIAQTDINDPNSARIVGSKETHVIAPEITFVYDNTPEHNTVSVVSTQAGGDIALGRFIQLVNAGANVTGAVAAIKLSDAEMENAHANQTYADAAQNGQLQPLSTTSVTQGSVTGGTVVATGGQGGNSRSTAHTAPISATGGQGGNSSSIAYTAPVTANGGKGGTGGVALSSSTATGQKTGANGVIADGNGNTLAIGNKSQALSSNGVNSQTNGIQAKDNSGQQEGQSANLTEKSPGSSTSSGGNSPNGVTASTSANGLSQTTVAQQGGPLTGTTTSGNNDNPSTTVTAPTAPAVPAVAPAPQVVPTPGG